MCFKILYFSRVRNWLGPIFSAAIIMIFVSCTNINEYVRNYQDCLTLAGAKVANAREKTFVAGDKFEDFETHFCIK
jgi:hypothetical protein